MYCPRCGSPNTDTTKYCRQCGLPMTQVSGYVATGGTGMLAPGESKSGAPLGKLTEGMTPKQQLILTILLWVMSPALLAILSETIGGRFFESLVPFAAISMPVGIIWSIFRYKAKKRLLEAQEAQFAQPLPGVYQQPAIEPPSYRPPIEPPRTSPLKVENRSPGSVTEDETRRLP